MENNVNVMTASNVPAVPQSPGPEIITPSSITEDDHKLCPLCVSAMKFFFINFNEKILMCENAECDFPFGYEDLQFRRVENDEDMSDVNSVKTKPSTKSRPSNSFISSGAWSEIDKINKVYDSEDSQLPETRQFTSSGKAKRNRKSTTDSESKIKKNVEEIKGLNMELKEITESTNILSNEKWISNLKHLQDQSGIQLLRPQELSRVRQDTKEVVIDITTDEACNMSSINVQLTDTNDA